MRGLLVDNFAGGGGASTGIEAVLRRPVDIAVNHDPVALAMHKANHPSTHHYCESVWDVDPRKVCDGRPVELAWFSPDCVHFSRARGDKPVSKNIRGLAWVTLRWAATVQPETIIVENVPEFQTWGPVVSKDGKSYPCPKERGREFRSWLNALRRHGYSVEWKELSACDYGAPTIRKRLFIIARRQGNIIWPEVTHGQPGNLFLRPYRTAAECIDWSIPCPSIFERKRPLAEATLRRIAAGIRRFVLNSGPYIIPLTHHGGDRVKSLHDPLPTITAAHRGEYALVSPTLIQTGYGEREGQAPRVPGLEKPLGTVVAGGAKHALVAAFLAKHYTGVTGQPVEAPVETVTSIDHHSLVTSHLIHLRGSAKDGRTIEAPLPTITAGGMHIGEVRALLLRHGGDGNAVVYVHGEPYVIADIGMRMLSPRELYRAQGFPDSYIIGDDPGQGLSLTKTEQIRLCGNSVSPVMSEALVRANMQTTMREAG